jgi:hypothetical protein
MPGIAYSIASSNNIIASALPEAQEVLASLFSPAAKNWCAISSRWRATIWLHGVSPLAASITLSVAARVVIHGITTQVVNSRRLDLQLWDGVNCVVCLHLGMHEFDWGGAVDGIGSNNHTKAP